MTRILQLLGAVLLLFSSPAIAKDSPAAWVVAQRSGQVQVIRNGLQPASLQVRAAVAPGDVVATGPDGRAMLTRGSDYIVVAPSSRLLLPKDKQPTGFTKLIQQVGTMFYKVRHTGVPHFAVDTPLLAAVVKGTSFTVVVEKDSNAVQVTEGVVEVSSADGKSRRLVANGMTVVVSRDRPSEVIEVKAANDERIGSDDDAVNIEGTADVPLSSVTDQTGGLVREAPVAPILASATTPSVIPGSGSSQPPATATEPVEQVVEDTTTVAAPIEEAVPLAGDPVRTVEETVAEPVTEVVEETAEPVVEVVEETVAPVVDVVEETTEPVVEVVEETVAPVVEVVEETITEPVVEVVEEIVTEPVVEVVETVSEPLVEAPVAPEPLAPVLGP